MNNNDKEFKEAIENLERRINEVSSNDGLFSLTFSGTGEYISCKINGRIEELDQDTLEKSIIECLNTQKKEVSEGVLNMILDLSKENKKIKDSNDKDDELGVTIKNVS